MSRIGKKPIPLASGVTVTVAAGTVTVQGPKGTLTMDHRPEVTVTVNNDDKQIEVAGVDDAKATRAFWGMTRALINNMVVGVTAGFQKDLDINGVGWNANVQGRTLALNVGYADTRKLDIPMGVDVEVSGARVKVSGTDKQAVGEFAAKVRAQRPPEPYNAKGIKYADEVIVRKEGKAFATGG